MPPRPSPVPWPLVILGLLVEAVVLVGATVVFAVRAARPGEDDPRSVAAAVDSLFGPLPYTYLAIVVGLAALLVLVPLALSVRPGGRLAGLVVGLVAQVPIVGWAVSAVVGGEDLAGPVLAVLVGGALVVLGALVPASWRWCRRSPAPVTP